MTNGSWTKIEDQEPECGSEVLVWYSYFSYRKNRRICGYAVATYINPVYQKLTGNGFVFETNNGTENVTHWQRLPEKPNA